ncbi:MAG TPA: D-alanyl-D-alanine carboxypeptidase family protein [Rariglobus sp.]|jgi:D-alanyl-D-alanine carboxypeptidase (penicillin-binding protein 5/6)|nr:D-alanyl-D-alanine carboxypeptidase family protein [Rariglobus sp.]
MTLLRFATLSLFALIALAPASAVAKSKGGEAQTGEWKGYIAIDAATGQVLAQDNPDLVTPPASMTKLMTFAVLHDKLQSGALTLNAPVKITESDAKMGGTQVFLDPSETFPVEDLMYAMMIQSANDAAHALARFSAGSVEAFVDLMNAKARELGMTHTTFRSPHGLPPSSRRIADGDLTTPRDYATLCRYLLTKTDILKYASVKTRDFGLSRAKGPQHMINHNKLLGTVEGVDGLKTGYTQGAGYCLSATALRGGHRVIVVIMGSFGPKGQIDKGRCRDRKTIEIFEQAFAAIPAGSPAFAGPAAPLISPAASPVQQAEQPEETPANSAPAASGGAADAPMVTFPSFGK